MRILRVLDRRIVIRPIPVQSQIIRQITHNAAHEIRIHAWPPGSLAHDGLTSLLCFSFRSGTICLNQNIRRLFRGNPILLRLFEELDDPVFASFDAGSSPRRRVFLDLDHGLEGGAGLQLRWRPGGPAADGDEGAAEVDFIHSPRNAGVVGSVGVGPVPEEVALVEGHGVGVQRAGGI